MCFLRPWSVPRIAQFAISTGLEVDPETFRNLPDILSYLKCPECGLEHAWWTREAWLEECAEIGPPDQEAA
jgi:hypothetical protein